MKQDAPIVGKSDKKYWYKHFITECPVCGRGEERKERQYTPPPPKDSQDRWDYNGMAYDNCLEY